MGCGDALGGGLELLCVATGLLPGVFQDVQMPHRSGVGLDDLFPQGFFQVRGVGELVLEGLEALAVGQVRGGDLWPERSMRYRIGESS